MSLSSTYKYYEVVLIACFAVFVLKVIASVHGYPYISNIDEPALIRSSLGLRFNLWIDHFDWPHLNFYLNYLLFEAFIKFRAVLQVLNAQQALQPYFPILWNDPFIFYFLSRALNSFWSVAVCVPIYFSALILFPDRENKYEIALFSSLSLLVFNVVTANSMLALQEPSLLFFSALILYASLKIYEEPRLKNFVLFGIALGLAASVKYNAGLLGLLALSFVFHDNSGSDIPAKKIYLKGIKGIIIALILSVVVFVLSNPSLYKYWEIFWSNTPGRGFLWQLNSNSEPLPMNEYFYALLGQIKDFIVKNLPVSIFTMVGSVLFVREIRINKSERNIMLFYFMFYILFFAFIARYGRAGPHYFIPLYPFFALITGFSTILFVRMRKNVMTWIVLVLVLFGIQMIPYIMRSNLTESIHYIEKQPVLQTVYVKGEDLENAVVINNLGFKKFKDQSQSCFDKIEAASCTTVDSDSSSGKKFYCGCSKIIQNDLVVTDMELGVRPDFELLRIFDYTHSLTKKVFIYRKIQ